RYAWSTRSGRPRRTASSAARSRACRLDDEPSTPTRTGAEDSSGSDDGGSSVTSSDPPTIRAPAGPQPPTCSTARNSGGRWDEVERLVDDEVQRRGPAGGAG